MSDIIKIQRSFAIKATHNPKHGFDRLYRIICQEEWIRCALDMILSNKGSRTAGIDGLTKKNFTSETLKQVFIQELQVELRERRFRPTPVRRIYIPKSNGRRPLGIPILKDRVVQLLLKMILEPIWESDFLNCSNGFRPKRRTMDCIALLDSYINNRSKYFWIIEGDIRGAFNNIHHEILLKLLAERVTDKGILNLIDRFLKAGMMEQNLFKRIDIGTPQGGVCSPLLANIYLHQLDLYWWRRYGNLDKKVKERRRTEHKGNCALIRYADDWLLLTNGGKETAYSLRDEFKAYLEVRLKLELSVEKTRVVHVNEGFDFLSFHIRRYVSKSDRPKLLVTPSKTAQERLKEKVKEMTARKRFRDKPILKFGALNSVLRGWINYYRYCNAKKTSKDLDFWVNERLFLWFQKRHRLPARKIMELYKKQQNGDRKNLAVCTGKELLFLYRMSDQPITKYRSRKPLNPYITENWVTNIKEVEVSLPEQVWLGNAENNEVWREIKAEVKSERGEKCELCGSNENLHLHHIKARQHGGQDVKENAQLLCRICHVQTPTYGKHKALQ